MITKTSILKIIVGLCILFVVWHNFLPGYSKRAADPDVQRIPDWVQRSTVYAPIKPQAPPPVKIENQVCHLVVCSLGNLGNQIWEYMSLFVVWKRFSNSGYIPSIEVDMSNNLKVFFPNLSISNGYETTKICADPRERRVISKINSLENYAKWFERDPYEECKTIYLDQYSARYDEVLAYGFDRLIREEMRFSPKLVEETQSMLHFYKRTYQLTNEDDVTFVGMHYRGGDYINHLEKTYASYRVAIPDYKYYVKAMNYFKESYPNVIFIFITIDMHWLKYNKEQIVNAGAGMIDINPYRSDRVHDLTLLSHCNHSIINYGTFGTTAALFTGGTTIVYNLSLPLDHRGTTIAMGITEILENWHAVG